MAGHDGPWAALGNRLAAERYGCLVLRAGVEDVAENETRFVWLARAGTDPGGPRVLASGSPPLGPWKTAVVFWGVGSEAPGWLVACLSEFAQRGVNLTRIESRPRKQGLGRYMFFVDMEGHEDDRRGRCRAGWAARPRGAAEGAGLLPGRLSPAAAAALRSAAGELVPGRAVPPTASVDCAPTRSLWPHP